MKHFHSKRGFALKLAVALLSVMSIAPCCIAAAPSEPGNLGIFVAQLFSDQQPTKRGALVVRRVDPDSAAADAGIHAGDVIAAVDGKSAFNTEAGELTQRFAGPAGSSVELSVAPPGEKWKTITLIRKPYPPHRNPQTDPFSYVVPGDWQADDRFDFPLVWSPELALKGFEDLYFSPGFDDLKSPEYHSYFFLWWLEGKREMTAAELEADMVVYFRGLAAQRGRNNNFKPDPSRVAAHYSPATQSARLGNKPASGFTGTVTIYDRHGGVISLYSEATFSFSADGHTAAVFLMSKEPRPATLWSQLDAIRDSLQYKP